MLFWSHLTSFSSPFALANTILMVTQWILWVENYSISYQRNWCECETVAALIMFFFLFIYNCSFLLMIVSGHSDHDICFVMQLGKLIRVSLKVVFMSLVLLLTTVPETTSVLLSAFITTYFLKLNYFTFQCITSSFLKCKLFMRSVNLIMMSVLMFAL